MFLDETSSLRIDVAHTFFCLPCICLRCVDAAPHRAHEDIRVLVRFVFSEVMYCLGLGRSKPSALIGDHVRCDSDRGRLRQRNLKSIRERVSRNLLWCDQGAYLSPKILFFPLRAVALSVGKGKHHTK